MRKFLESLEIRQTTSMDCSIYNRLTRRVLREAHLPHDRRKALMTSAASLSNATVTFETSFQSRVFALLLAPQVALVHSL